jgi:hypothetical protein
MKTLELRLLVENLVKIGTMYQEKCSGRSFEIAKQRRESPIQGVAEPLIAFCFMGGLLAFTHKGIQHVY